MKSTTLYYREGSSDKVYQAAIEPKDHLFVVTFAYGRRGTTLQTGVKTPAPVDLSVAENVFDKLVRDKVSKGYTPGESGTPYENSEKAGAVSGILPQLLNAIDEAEALAFAKSSLWCMQEKMDGRRLLVKKESADIQGINRRGLVIGLPAPLLQALQKIPNDFILDGECVGETFHAFDLLSWKGENWRKRAYERRLRALDTILRGYENGSITTIETLYDEVEKLSALKGLEECGAEGVVFKLISAPYTPGRPASGGFALKYKFTAAGSFIVSELNECRSVGLKLFQNNASLGNVTIPPNQAIPKLGSVVEVRYLYAYRGGSLYQPVYLGAREDIDPTECVMSQLKFKRDESDDEVEYAQGEIPSKGTAIE